MEFLKALFGDQSFTYEQLVKAVESYNADDKNKEKLIKMINLSDGGYVSTDKYKSLETDLSGKKDELQKAQDLIEELKKGTNKDEDLQGKISQYETDIANLQAENEKLKVENALKFELAQAGAKDVDYLIYKATSDGTELKLDAQGKIKGLDGLLEDLKTKHPTMFEEKAGNPARKILENNLPGGDPNKTVTKEQFLAMGYEERMKIKKENPELFAQLNKH